MSANNNCTFMGRLTADPELKTTQNGKKLCSFTLAVDGRNKEGTATFVNFTAWEKQAEFIAQYFTKGRRMLVNGELCNNSYTDKDGNKRSSYIVRVGETMFCDSKTTSSNDVCSKSNEPAASNKTNERAAAVTADDVDGDLPF